LNLTDTAENFYLRQKVMVQG